MKKRSLAVFKFFVCAFVFLCAVMLKIVLTDGRKYADAAANQHLAETRVKIYREMIYDRNLIPFVDCRSYILSINDSEKSARYSVTKRYDDRSLARHLIGYVDSENTGVSGIEKRFDEYLRGAGGYVINEINDVNRRKITFLPETVKNDGSLRSGISLTLDYHIQSAVEGVLEKVEKNSAVTVLDVNSFDVLAMASRPNFDQNDIEKYINGGGSELINRAVSEYNAGSIFKIITAAAALENGIASVEDVFECSGDVSIDGQKFVCNKKEGHGKIDFKEAFANSCNVCFYDLAIKTGFEKLCATAKNFGIGEMISDIEGEKTGSAETGTTRCDIANSAIGQGKILITPLQAAKIAAIIASGGVSKNVNIVNGRINSDLNKSENMYYESKRRVVSEQTAQTIKDMMYLAVAEGTGIGAYDKNLGICGKTGSAQTGWMDDEGCFMVHGWFVGFFPYDNPKYAMSVFLENGKSGAEAAKVFLDIAHKICEY